MTVTQDLKKRVWEKATIVEGYDPMIIRKDPCGAWILWERYGQQDNIYGWEIDHICPKNYLISFNYSEDEIDVLDNLRAMQHQNNASKGDDYPSYTAVVSAEKEKNIDYIQNLTVNKATRDELKKHFKRIKQ